MPSINRATLPQEFFDITSAKLLTPPEPQYFHCRMFQAAFNGAMLNAGGSIGLPVPGRAFGTKGEPYLTDIEGLVLSDPIMSNAIEVVPEIGAGHMPGHTIRLNRPSFANTTYTRLSRIVTEDTAISVVPIAVPSEQVPVTVERWAGPYDQANTRVAPLGIGRFDGSFMLHRPAMVKSLHLQRDYKRTMDQIVRDAFDLAGSNVYPVGMLTDASPVLQGDSPFSFGLLAATERTLDDLNVPLFPDGKRCMVLHPTQCEQLSQDANFQRLAEFHPEFNPAFAGTYWKSCGAWNIFKSTTLSSIATGGVPGTLTVRYGQAFGPGAVGMGIAELPRVAYNSQDNYGENALVIWLQYAGIATFDSRFIARIHTC